MKTDTSRHDKPLRWHVERPYGEEGTYITEDSTALIAKVYPRGYPSSNLTQAEKLEQQQRAALIAAAPELLEALRYAVECINAGCKRRAPDANNGRGVATTNERRALEYARKAIEKAEGEKAL